jgi:hypothetical protein
MSTFHAALASDAGATWWQGGAPIPTAPMGDIDGRSNQ